MNKLPASFYARPDVVQITRELLGKVLCTNFDGQLTSGMITEAEAYCGATDKACHAFGRRTPRTETLYGQPGKAYVYLCYGIHHLFNVVTNIEGLADAILIRAVEPLEGVQHMLERRKKDKPAYNLTAGPGSMAQALGIYTHHNESDLNSPHLWIEDRGIRIADDQILSGPRVGVDYAGEDAKLPWRFVIKDNPWVSRPKIKGD